MTAAPGSEPGPGPGARGHLRASHADREQVIGTLKAAFVLGMLTKAEFDERVGQTLDSRTYAELAAPTADLPAGTVMAWPPSAPARKPVRRTVKVVAWGAGLSSPLAVLTGAIGGVTGNAGLLTTSVFAVTGLTAVTYAAITEISTQKRSGGQLPGGPAQDAAGRTSDRAVLGDGAGQPPSADKAPWQSPATPARSLLRPRLSY